MTYAFSVAADATDGYAVTSALDAAHAALGDEASVVALAPEHLDPGVAYAFTVRRPRSFAGGTSAASAVVEKTQHPTPTVRALGGSSRVTRRSEPTRLEVEARAPSHACAALNASDVGAGMSFAWTLVGGPCSSRPIFPRRRRATRTSPRRERARCTCRRTSFARETYRWRLRTTLDVNPARFFTDTFVTLDVASESARRRRRRGNVRRRVPQRAARPARGRARPGRRDGRAWGAVPVHVRVVVRHARGRRVRREPRQRSRVVSLERADGDVSRGDVSRRGRVRLHRERRARTRRRRTRRHRVHDGSYRGGTGDVDRRGRADARAVAPRRGSAGGRRRGVVARRASREGVRLRRRRRHVRRDVVVRRGRFDRSHRARRRGGDGSRESHPRRQTGRARARGRDLAFRASAGGSAAGLVADVVFDVNAPPRGGRVVAEFTASRADQPVADEDADAVAALGFARVTIRASQVGDDARTRPSREFYDVGADGSLAPLGPTTSSNAVDAWLPSGTRVIRARVADALGAATFADATVTVAPAPAPSPPPPPSPHPPPYTGTRSSGTVPPPPREGDDSSPRPRPRPRPRTTSRRLWSTWRFCFAPATGGEGPATRAAQVAKAYADRYAATTPGVVVPDCAGLDPIAEHHAEVARAIRDARDATARTTPGVTMTLCAAAALTGDPTTITASTMANLGATFAAEAAAATTPDLDAVTIAPEGVRCAATLASNLLAAVESGCAPSTSVPEESTATALSAAFDLALTSAARALVPGGAHISAHAAHVSAAVGAAEPSAAVGFPLAVSAPAIDDSDAASATFGLDRAAAGASFVGGDGVLVARVSRFRLGTVVDQAASASAGERLASEFATIRVAHPDVDAFVASRDAPSKSRSGSERRRETRRRTPEGYRPFGFTTRDSGRASTPCSGRV